MTWSALGVPGQPELNSEILSQNKSTSQANTRRERNTDLTQQEKVAMLRWFSARITTGQTLTNTSQSAQSAVCFYKAYQYVSHLFTDILSVVAFVLLEQC